MKTQIEIGQLAKEQYLKRIDDFQTNDFSDGVFVGYQQAIEDFKNSWTKGCECENSIGQTWCCNQCGLPYDTRKTENKYTEEDMLKCWNYLLVNIFCKNPVTFKDYINSLNKQE